MSVRPFLSLSLIYCDAMLFIKGRPMSSCGIWLAGVSHVLTFAYYVKTAKYTAAVDMECE